MQYSWEQVHGYAEQKGISLRSAATAMAVERVAKAHELRGLYP